MNSFHLRILAADDMFFEGECENLVVPCPDGGSFGVQAYHDNMISAVAPGELHYRPAGGDGEEKIAAVSSGLIKIENNDVLVLVDTAERPEEIDANRARRAADEAKEEILQKRSIQEYRIAQYNLARAMSRLRVRSDFESWRK